MVTDPIADLLTCIRNALHARKGEVEVPWSRLKQAIVQAIVDEGFLLDCSVASKPGHKRLRIRLKYDGNGRPVLRGVQRVSKPSLRKYVKAGAIPRVRNGLGVHILTTPRGVLADREARRLGVGGEVVCGVW